MRAKKVDAVHQVIAQAFRSCGCSVLSIAPIGCGAPDLVVGFRGRTVLVEVKAEKGKLNERQREFWRDWKGRIVIARTTEDVERIMQTLL